MAKAFLVVRVPALVEIIHVKLAHKRTEVVVLEVFGEHMFGKFVRVCDDETCALIIPKHRVRVLGILKSLSTLTKIKQ